MAKVGYRSVMSGPRVTLPDVAGAPTRGPENAPITLVEFSDFQCNFCRRAHPTVERVLEEYGDKIHFIYRDYPLKNHNRARHASVAAFCAMRVSVT